MKPVKMKLTFLSGEGSFLKQGTPVTMNVEIIDEYAAFRFNSAGSTKDFALTQQRDGVESRYSERLQKCLSRYPNMTAIQIINHLKNRLKILKNSPKLNKTEIKK